jgi:hypothetical protein
MRFAGIRISVASLPSSVSKTMCQPVPSGTGQSFM